MLDNLLYLFSALVLVVLNGFFVAIEFALIKTRPARLEQLVAEGRPFASTTLWLSQRLDASLAACQLGITMASLGLGWVGEPAFASLLEPLLHGIGVESEVALHGIAFTIAFTLITALHLIAGEQVPKIFAIRAPERVALPLGPPLKVFYILAYPLLKGLSATTSFVLRLFGIENGAGHDAPHTEEEIRALMRLARSHGELSRTEDRLLHAVFEFDDMLCRRVMLPRADIVWVDADAGIDDAMALARQTKHSRYPVCEGSLDQVVGVAHTKDLIGAELDQGTTMRDLMRPPRYVPETMPISRLLRHFQVSHQHLAFVVDEHGTVTGLVTLENVLEQIVGPVEDEFDSERPAIVPQGDDEYLIDGSTPIDVVNRKLELKLDTLEADTLSGLLTHVLQRVPEVGDIVTLPGASAEVLEMVGARAVRVRLELRRDGQAPVGEGSA